MFKHMKFSFTILNLMPATHFKKEEGQERVYHCVTSPFLLSKCLKMSTLKTHSLSVESRIVFYSCLMYILSCSAAWGSLCSILCFITPPFSIEDRSGLKAGVVKWLHSFTLNPCFCNSGECGSYLSEIGRDIPGKKCHLNGGIFCYQSFMYLSDIMVLRRCATSITSSVNGH